MFEHATFSNISLTTLNRIQQANLLKKYVNIDIAGEGIKNYLHLQLFHQAFFLSRAAASLKGKANVSLASLPRQHEFVALGVGAHGQMRRLAVFLARLVGEDATGSGDLGGSSHHIGHLKA